jgi:hypothetical protein
VRVCFCQPYAATLPSNFTNLAPYFSAAPYCGGPGYGGGGGGHGDMRLDTFPQAPHYALDAAPQVLERSVDMVLSRSDIQRER